MPLQKYTYNKKTYTVDYRLNQFRSEHQQGHIIFTDFTSELGDKILAKMIKENIHNQALLHL